MKNMKAYLNLSNGEKQDFLVKLTEKLEEGVHAVYIEGFSKRTLDSEFGAGIEIELENVKSWMADFRHCEFWCRPKFGTALSNIPNETLGRRRQSI